MDTTIKPDPKFQTKIVAIHLTVTAFIALPILIIGIFIAILEPNKVAPLVLGGIFLLTQIITWVIVFPLVRLWISKLSYVIRDDRVSLYKGILTKTEQNIPFRAVTDFVLQRTLYDRWLNIGSVKIQTAGQSQSVSGYEGVMAGLLEYERWHSELRDRIKAMHGPAGPQTTGEDVGQDDLFPAMLAELQAIRKALEGRG